MYFIFYTMLHNPQTNAKYFKNIFKFKKPNHFHSSPHANSSSFKPFQSSSFKPKTSGQKTDGRFCYICGRTNHMAPQCFNWKKEPIKA